MRFLVAAGHILYLALEVIFFFVALWFLLAFILSVIRVNTDYVPPKGSVEIYIRSNGIHTDFVIPVHHHEVDWDTIFPPQIFGADSTWSHIAFGWGDKRFYLYTPRWSDLKLSTALLAASGLGESALHVTYYQYPLKESKRTNVYRITNEQYHALVNYIKKSIRSSNSKPTLIDHPGYGHHDRFFESYGSYSLINTCNQWTGEGMKEAGLPIGTWTPLEPSIMQK